MAEEVITEKEFAKLLVEDLSNILHGEKIPLDVVDSDSGEILIPANRKITKIHLLEVARKWNSVEIDPSPIRNKVRQIIRERLEKSPFQKTIKRPHRWAKAKNQEFDAGMKDYTMALEGDCHAACKVGIAFVFCFRWELAVDWLGKAVEGGVKDARPYLDLARGITGVRLTD